MRYSAFGLCLESAVDLPGFVASDAAGETDIVIRFDTACSGIGIGGAAERVWYQSEWRDDRTGEPGLTIYRSGTSGTFRLHHFDGFEFIVAERGNLVLGLLPAGSTIDDAVPYLTGPVLGFLLRMRGVVCLHASAVAVGDIAIAFVGDSGAGKSTTAAALARRGYKVLTEDIAALFHHSSGGFAIRRGGADLGLWPSAVALIYGSSDALPRYCDGWEKRRLDLAATGILSECDVPIGAVYVLANRGMSSQAPFIAPLAPRHALVHLLGNMYGNRLFHDEMRVRELDAAHRLVRSVPVKMATAGGEDHEFGRFCNMILDDVARTSGACLAPSTDTGQRQR